jgi:hypothetical protein
MRRKDNNTTKQAREGKGRQGNATSKAQTNKQLAAK